MTPPVEGWWWLKEEKHHVHVPVYKSILFDIKLSCPFLHPSFPITWYILGISHTNIHLLFLQKNQSNATNNYDDNSLRTVPKNIDIRSNTQILNSLNPLTSTLPVPFFLHSASLSWWVLLLVWWRWFLFLGKPRRFLCLLVNLGGGIEGRSSWLAVVVVLVVVVIVVVVVSSKEEREEKLSDS